MTGPGRRFDPAELIDTASSDDASVSPADLMATTAIARELEAIAERDTRLSDAFTDRVMGAIATEPTPQPTFALGVALRARRTRSALGAIGDAFRVAFGGGGRPLVARGPAFALALVVLVGVIGTGGGIAVGAAQLLTPDGTPMPTEVLPSPSPSPSPSAEPTPSPTPTPTPTPTESPGATETAGPTGTDDLETPEGTDDSGGDRSGSDDSGVDDSSGSGSGSDHG